MERLPLQSSSRLPAVQKLPPTAPRQMLVPVADALVALPRMCDPDGLEPIVPPAVTEPVTSQPSVLARKLPETRMLAGITLWHSRLPLGIARLSLVPEIVLVCWVKVASPKKVRSSSSAVGAAVTIL